MPFNRSLEYTELDLLIRSASSLLSIISQQIDPTPSRVDIARSVRFLDRIALLFVTKPKQDVSALSVVLARDSCVLVDVPESSADISTDDHDTPAYVDYLLISKSSKKVPRNNEILPDRDHSSEPAIPSINTSKPTWNASDDWLCNCFWNGPLGPVEHAAQLEFLLGQISIQEGIMSEGAQNFTRFIYYQCYQKVNQRLNAPVARGGLPFRKIFVADTTKFQQLASRFRPDSCDIDLEEKILRHGDGWIAKSWQSIFNWSPSFEEYNGVKHLIHDPKMIVSLYRLICLVFQRLFAGLEQVRHARQVHTRVETLPENYLSDLCSALDAVAYYMDFFTKLVKSPCFWKLLQHPVLREWVSRPAGRELDQDDESSYDTDDEDVAEAQGKAILESATAVVRWLQSATQWSVAISEIISPNRESTKILLATGVRIISVRVPAVQDSKKQASLKKLLKYVMDGSPYGWSATKKALQNTAKIVTDNNSRTDWNRLMHDRWNDWETDFTGKHHCESVLASLLEMQSQDELVNITKRANKVIGVSRRCCFCCALYIRHLNRYLSFGGTSGKAYPWVLPPWFQKDDVGHIILEKLSSKLRGRLESIVAATLDNRDSGSDSGRSDDYQGGPNVERPVPEDDIHALEEWDYESWEAGLDMELRQAEKDQEELPLVS